MKNALYLLLTATLFSCTADEIQEEEPTLDCDCDRIVDIATFNIVGSPVTYYSIYTTINDCTGIQREHSSSTPYANLIPQEGDCKN